MTNSTQTNELRLYTVRVAGETASGVQFNERRRVAATDYAGATAGVVAMFPGCRVFSTDVESVR